MGILTIPFLQPLDMPFRARMNGDVVPPAAVPGHEPVECLECKSTMYPRDGDDRARHFYHVADDAPDVCPNARGESDTHARCTAIAAEALNSRFGDKATRRGIEIVLETPSTPTDPDHRRADALIEFQSRHDYYGRGIIIEVQHKHHSKDIEGTTYDYLSAGYSVAWVTPADFEANHLEYDVMSEAFKAADGEAYSVREHDPWDFEPRIESRFRWDEPAHDDPIGDGHDWIRIPAYAHPDGYGYEACHCGARRRYDHQRARFVYDHEGILAPSRPTVEIPQPTKDGVLQRVEEDLEIGLMLKVTVAPCRGPKRVHEWGDRTDYEHTTSWTCEHCPVRLVRGVDDHLSLVGDPNISVRYLLEGDRVRPPESDAFCTRCDEFTEATEFGECQQCYGISLVQSLLDSFPENWRPTVNFPSGVSGYMHQCLDISVGIHRPAEGVDVNSEQSVEDTESNQKTFFANVTWPNHLPRHSERVVPEPAIVDEDEAKAWAFHLLRSVDEDYDVDDITSVGRAFGSNVEASTRESPVVDDDLNCAICGAYLPHYCGDSPRAWYRFHREYVDDGSHPKPKHENKGNASGDFDGGCPHCERASGDPNSMIDHLEEHEYSRSDAFSISRRIW